MFKINLVPEVKQEQIKLKKINFTVTTVAIVVAAVVVIVSLILLSYIVARKAQISSINKETDKINGELVAYKDLEQTVITLEGGLTDIKQIITGGPKWSKFFTELEKVTPGDVQLTSLKVDGNSITMDVVAKDVKSIDRFIKSFSNYKIDDKNLFSDVLVSGYEKKESSVTFQAEMSLVGGVLW
jgi:Tfp pilus assembly protein PilN